MFLVMRPVDLSRPRGQCTVGAEIRGAVEVGQDRLHRGMAATIDDCPVRGLVSLLLRLPRKPPSGVDEGSHSRLSDSTGLTRVARTAGM